MPLFKIFEITILNHKWIFKILWKYRYDPSIVEGKTGNKL